MKKYCDHCGQEIKLAYKEIMTKHKLTMLKDAANKVIETGVNDFNLHDLMGEYNNYNNFQKLRYHGLVHRVVKNGIIQRGHWLITRNGWAFLRGEISIHKWVTVRQNHIVDRSDELIFIKDVFYGSEVITTSFQYFDNDGNMVGWRPMGSKNLNQLSLLT